METRVSVVIPTHNRPGQLGRAIASALEQDHADVDVVVVDDGSEPPAELGRFEADDQVRLVRLESNRGVSAARNRGAAEASGRYVTFLDDDDMLLPGVISRSLAAIAASDLPKPVAALSSLEVVDASGQPQRIRRAPTLPRGRILGLDTVPRGTSAYTKHTLVVDRDLFLSAGGFDEDLKSRVQTELFFRLGPLLSLQGIETPGYRFTEHGDTRISGNPQLRRQSFRRLARRHVGLALKRPRGFADLIDRHAKALRALGFAGEAALWRLASGLLKLIG